MVTSREWYGEPRNISGISISRFRFRFYTLDVGEELTCQSIISEGRNSRAERAKAEGLKIVPWYEINLYISPECWREGRYVVKCCAGDERAEFWFYKGQWFKTNQCHEIFPVDYPELPAKEWEILKASAKMKWLNAHWSQVYRYWNHQYQLRTIRRESRLSMRIFLRKLEGLVCKDH